MNKTHVPLIGDFDGYVTIVRNPKDSIISRIAMELEYEPNPKPMDELVSICQKEYIIFYNYILKNIDTVFAYEDLDKVDEMVKFLSNKFNIPIIKDEFVDNISDRPSTKFLKTSKTSAFYHYVRSELDSLSLEEENLMYEKTLSKAIRF